MTDDHAELVAKVRAGVARLTQLSAARAVLDQVVAEVRHKASDADIDLTDPAQARAFFEGVALAVGTAAPAVFVASSTSRDTLLYLQAAALEIMDGQHG